MNDLNQTSKTGVTYWIRWHAADGVSGPRIGPFDHRQEADAARRDQVRVAAEAMEHGTGTAGAWTQDGALYRDDLDDRYLGRYVIERDTAERTPGSPTTNKCS